MRHSVLSKRSLRLGIYSFELAMGKLINRFISMAEFADLGNGLRRSPELGLLWQSCVLGSRRIA